LFYEDSSGVVQRIGIINPVGRNGAAVWITSVAGTNTITGSLTPALTAYGAGQSYRFVAAATNTGAVTININGLGARAITKNGTTPLIAGDIPVGATMNIIDDGTRFQLSGNTQLSTPGPIGNTTPNSGAFTTLSATSDATINTVPVGLGAGNVPFNVRMGQGALVNNTGAGVGNVAFGGGALSNNTSGQFNSGGGVNVLQANSTGSNNTGFGHQALIAATGGKNSAFGSGSGSAITTGTGHSILGSFTGNQGGYDIRTSSNNVVLSDGDGNVKLIADASGNVGIGGTPAYKLDVRGGVLAVGNGTIFGGISYSTRPEIGSISNHPVGFITNNTTQMLLDVPGNLGLGVVPSAWDSTYKVYQSGRASYGGDNSSLIISHNAYYNSGWKYIATGTQATVSDQFQGTFRWFSSPSGTAGNAITFTQSLAVGLGTTLALEGATSAAGTGIAFPATQLASSNANTLDDYEEGTWTPTQGAGLTVVGTFSSSGTYTKVGRQVTVVFILSGSTSIAAAAGGIACAGLPFAGTVNGTGSLTANTSGSITGVCLVSGTNLFSSTIATSTIIYGSATYFV
jgi:hypothetical protein